MLQRTVQHCASTAHCAGTAASGLADTLPTPSLPLFSLPSSQPNVQVAYLRGDNVAAVVALRPIAEGEELCINYIDKEQPLAVRQNDLRHYGFRCSCQKCMRQTALGQ